MKAYNETREEIGIITNNDLDKQDTEIIHKNDEEEINEKKDKKELTGFFELVRKKFSLNFNFK